MTGLAVFSDDQIAPLKDQTHLDYLAADSERQRAFFRKSLRDDGGFDILDWKGKPLARGPQELHTTTRMVHSYALAAAQGDATAAPLVEAGLHFLWHAHRDRDHGGYFWSVGTGGDASKLAYGHVFVLLAASSALRIGHRDAPHLFEDIVDVINARFWDEEVGLLREEFAEDWSPISEYHGMNANMHGTEAFLAAYEATGDTEWLARAGRILAFFTDEMAGENGGRIPEHYTKNWQVDRTYSGNPMFRPAGTTPGHSFEFGRLALHHWDLTGRRDDGAVTRARGLIDQAFEDAWMPDGGLAYTLDYTGKISISDRYWWPVTEAMGAYAAMMKIEDDPRDADRYRQLWMFADAHFIDSSRGGWYPEIDDTGAPTARQFEGKPDIYHSLQAVIFPRSDGLKYPF